jgi:hypothetical protein
LAPQEGVAAKSHLWINKELGEGGQERPFVAAPSHTKKFICCIRLLLLMPTNLVQRFPGILIGAKKMSTVGSQKNEMKCLRKYCKLF